jgi:prepilin signal peptidase PulO-like enzyme (type II secretory pathway)
VSGESWVGGGDWILCIPLALMLGNAWLSAFCLFISNIVGTIMMLPVALAKKKKRMVIPFGPFLIIGFLITFFLQISITRFVGF